MARVEPELNAIFYQDSRQAAEQAMPMPLPVYIEIARAVVRCYFPGENIRLSSRVEFGRYLDLVQNNIDTLERATCLPLGKLLFRNTSFKLAANIALGRNAAGTHWRSDSLQGLLLGEAFALSILADLALTYHQKFAGFTLTRFDGRRVTIGA